MIVRALVHVVLVLGPLAACGGDSKECPSNGISCGEAGDTCQNVNEDGSTSYCECNGATWTCNSCPGGMRPVGACEAGQTCGVYGFENSCACSCDADGQWHCVKDDPDPNFHCSP